MWEGNYSFFDYKYNIEGYSGQDYDGAARWWYLALSVAAILVLLFVFRAASLRNVERYLRVVAIVMPVLEIVKITWESVWDVKTGRGFNWEGLLPIYTCSLFLYCMAAAALSRGRLREMCLSWVCTIGFVGGMSNLLFIQGLKWYPVFTFGAMYSMVFHFVMVFTALFFVVTGFVRFRFRNILWAAGVHLAFSAAVIPVDYIFHWDYMQYYDAGCVPLIEGAVDRFEAMGARFLCVPLMLAAYFALDAVLGLLYLGYAKLSEKVRSKA